MSEKTTWNIRNNVKFRLHLKSRDYTIFLEVIYIRQYLCFNSKVPFDMCFIQGSPAFAMKDQI